MDPNVQVAFIGVFATLISTIGVVTVAFMNNLRRQVDKAETAVKVAKATDLSDGLDEHEVFRQMLRLIEERDEKDRELSASWRKNLALTTENRQLRAENTMLRLNQKPDE